MLDSPFEAAQAGDRIAAELRVVDVDGEVARTRGGPAPSARKGATGMGELTDCLTMFSVSAYARHAETRARRVRQGAGRGLPP